jgi:hypothetical protein
MRRIRRRKRRRRRTMVTSWMGGRMHALRELNPGILHCR